MKIVGFADDIAVIGIGHTTDLLEIAVNPALEMVAEWMSQNGLRISGGEDEDYHADVETRLYEARSTPARRTARSV